MEIAERLAHQVFPLYIDDYVLHLRPEATSFTDPPLRVGKRLRDPRAQFDREGRRQYNKILEGLSEAGSYQKPEESIQVVFLCPPEWSEMMSRFISQLQRGSYRYQGVERTFGIKLEPVTELIGPVGDYEEILNRSISDLVEGKRPIFIIFAPERGYSRANYDSPYYKSKRLLLEAGYPSQMVREETLEKSRFKDFNFALDVFAKAGYVPWVLAEGLPQADLFIGLSYSTLQLPDGARRLIGYVNVFDDYGRWHYYDGSSVAIPFDKRGTELGKMVAQVVREQSQVKRLRWIHIHHAAKLRRSDRDAITESILNVENEASVSFVHVNRHSIIRFYNEAPRSQGRVSRGVYVRVSSHRFCIATTGDNPQGQKGVGTPRPLEITVYVNNQAEPVDLAVYAQHILSLTRLNWASTRDFSREPITTKFAGDIAYFVNVFHSDGQPFKLHPALKKTPWFL
jgi:hypothetical protein